MGFSDLRKRQQSQYPFMLSCSHQYFWTHLQSPGIHEFLYFLTSTGHLLSSFLASLSIWNNSRTLLKQLQKEISRKAQLCRLDEYPSLARFTAFQLNSVYIWNNYSCPHFSFHFIYITSHLPKDRAQSDASHSMQSHFLSILSYSTGLEGIQCSPLVLSWPSTNYRQTMFPNWWAL